MKVWKHLNRIFKSINIAIANYSHKYRVRYLKSLGMELGKNVRFNCNMDTFGSEPYLISIGDDCLIAADVRFITHDGAIKVINSLGMFEKPMTKMGGGVYI